MPTPYPKAVAAALGSLVVALVTIVTVFNLVHWSAAQTALVTAEAAAAAGLCGALVAHFMPGTSREPVALAATLTAMISATTALGSGFAWWRFTEQETSALVGVITAILGIGSALFARHHVSPKPPLGRVVAENTPE